MCVSLVIQAISCGIFFFIFYICVSGSVVSSTLKSKRKDFRRLLNSSVKTISIYRFTVDLILMRAILTGAKFCTHFVLKGSICWQFLVAAGSSLKHMDCLTKEHTHCSCFIRLQMDRLPPVSPHRWECLLTQTLSGSQSYNITRRTYLTDLFFIFYLVSVQFHPTCLSEISLKPRSLGFQKCVYVS